MSLRGRLLLVLITLNLTVLGIVQIAAVALQANAVQEHVEAYDRFLQDAVAKVYVSEEDASLARVHRLLSHGDFGKYFHDLLITNVISHDRSPQVPGYVDLNPMGADRRDADRFPLAEIRDGIKQAMDSDATVAAGGGFCVPIVADRGVVAGAWYSPIIPPVRLLPFWVFAIPVLLSTCLFGVFAFYWIGRSVVRPLQSLGRAASRVGAGEYVTRVGRVPHAHELDPMVDAFNSMAVRVKSHTEDLQREVARATEEAARKERALVQSSRLAAIGTLAAGIAHEINNPIGGMLNAVVRLSEAADISARDRRYLELIREGLERVSRTARKVLDFSPRQIEPTPFAVHTVIEGARSLVDHRLRRQGVAFTADLPDHLPLLVGDAHEIQQVFLNLFLNALDVLEDRAGGRIDVQGRRDAGVVECVVTDNGPGAEAEVLARVLDPFFSGKSDPQSSGLGMFISYSIVRNHGGSLSIDSAPGEGFRVTIRLPVAGRDADDKGAAPPPAAAT